MLPAADNSILIDAVFQEAREKGIRKVTASDIARRCNCSRQTLYYHHVGGVNNVIEYVLLNDHKGITHTRPEEPYWRRETYRLLFSLKDRKEFYLDVYGTKYRSDLLTALTKHMKEDIIPDLLSCHQSRRSERMGELNNLIAYVFVGRITQWMTDGFHEDPSDILEILSRLCGPAMHRMADDYLSFAPTPFSTIA